MANETFVKTLKKASSNNELPAINDFKFVVDAYTPFSTSNYIIVTSTDTSDTTEMPNGEFLNAQGVSIGSSVTNTGTNRYPSTEGGVVLIHNKQNVRTLNFKGNTGKHVSLDNLKYLTLNKLVLEFGFGDVKDVTFDYMTDLSLTGDGFFGTISSMIIPRIKNLLLVDVIASGAITVFAELQAIEKIVLGRCNNLTGSIEALVNGFRTRSTNPLSSGSLTCAVINCPNITFNGSPCTNSGASTQLSWTATTITYNGVTITA